MHIKIMESPAITGHFAKQGPFYLLRTVTTSIYIIMVIVNNDYLKKYAFCRPDTFIRNMV